MDAEQQARSAAQTAERTLVETCYAGWMRLGFGGVAHGDGDAADRIIDIEALVLASLVARDGEHRLDDALGWWASVGLGVTNRYRARALLKRWPDEARRRWPAFARLAEATGARGWSGDARAESTLNLAPRSGKGAKHVCITDPACLMARMRTGLGTGARADVLTWAIGLGANAGTVSDAVDALAYSDVALRAAMQEMERAGLLERRRGSALSVCAAEGWRDLLALPVAPVWQNSARRSARLVDIVVTVGEGQERGWSDYVWHSRGRDLAERHDAPVSDADVWLRLADRI